MTTLGIDKLGYGPLEGLPQFFSSAALGTTPVKVTLPSPTTLPVYGVKIKIVNGHASNYLAWSLVKNGAAAPSTTADFVNATCGSIINPLSSETFSLVWGAAPGTPAVPWFDLYVVGSAANTTVNVTFSLIAA